MTSKYTTKSTPITIRLPNELLREIDEIRVEFDEDRATWIRKAISIAMNVLEKEADNETIEDYINLRLTEEDLLDEMDWKDVPKDLKKARETIRQSIIRKRKHQRGRSK